MFELVQSLSEGKQPPSELINDIGYLMRTKVYGNENSALMIEKIIVIFLTFRAVSA